MKSRRWGQDATALLNTASDHQKITDDDARDRLRTGYVADRRVWQLGNQTDINTYRGVGAASTQFCKVNVVATPAGIVRRYVALSRAYSNHRKSKMRRCAMGIVIEVNVALWIMIGAG